MMNTRNSLIFLSFILVALIAACAPAKPEPTATIAPTATVAPLRTPTPSPSPTITPTPAPTATPTPALKPLTTGGCCVQPSWSLDSSQVLFIDKPSASDAAGLYAVDIATLKPPQKVGPVAAYSRDRSLITYLDKRRTIVEKVATGDKWVIPNNGQSIAFSPDAQKLAWGDEDDNDYIPYDQRRSDLYIAKFDGTEATRITRVYGGGFVGWLPDSNKILLSGRPALDVRERTLSVLDLATKSLTKLVTSERISGVSISNDGTWIAYYITFDTDKSRNGLWLQRTDGSPPRKLELWGAYQWRDGGRLLVIPTRTSRDRAFEVLEVEATTGKIRKLTDAAVTPLQILNGDWRVSPDGRHIVYVNSVDRNLWLLTLLGNSGQ